MKRFGVVTFVAGVVTLTACFPSLDGLVGNTVDAGSASGDGGDVPPNGDGGSSTDPWCKTHGSAASFCCDFDPSDPSVCGVSSNNDGNGVFVVDSKVFDSPPAALSVSIPMTDAGGTAFARSLLEYNAKASSTNEADLSFSLRLEKVGPPNSMGLANLDFSTGSKAWESRLNIDTSGHLYVSQFDPKTSDYSEPYRAPMPLPVGVWTRVRFHTKISSVGQATADLEVDGKPLTTGLSMHPTLTGGSLQVLLGITFVRSPSTGWALHVDNVLLTPK